MESKTRCFVVGVNEQNMTMSATMYADGWFNDEEEKVSVYITQTDIGEADVKIIGNETRFEGKMVGVGYDKLYIKTFFDNMMRSWINRIINEYGDEYVRDDDGLWRQTKLGIRGTMKFSFDPVDGGWIGTFEATEGTIVPIIIPMYIFHIYAEKEYFNLKHNTVAKFLTKNFEH